jgi:hypothetical protein
VSRPQPKRSPSQAVAHEPAGAGRGALSTQAPAAQAPSPGLAIVQTVPAGLLAPAEQAPPEQKPAFLHAVAGAHLTPAQGL